MKLRCLVLCDELKSLSVLCPVLDKYEICREICVEAAEAAHLLKTAHFDAVVADCDDLESGKQFLQDIRQGKSNRTAISFALVNGGTSVQDAFAMGASFVLEKPLSANLVLRALKVGIGFMLAQRRHSFRHTLDTEVTVNGAQGSHRVRSQNVSETGIRLSSIRRLLKPQELVSMSFQLPQPDANIECKAEVVWVGDSGDAGLQFVDIPPSCTKKLQLWLHQAFEQQMEAALTNSARMSRPHS